MPKRADFRQKAEYCRKLLRAATASEVREQLRVWIREFEEQADADNPEPTYLKQVLANSPS
jgi:hypothetical protein